jgi:hypothetical protein
MNRLDSIDWVYAASSGELNPITIKGLSHHRLGSFFGQKGLSQIMC